MRVLVADDHSLFRDGIISLLEAAGFDVVGQAGDGEEAVQQALALRPDLVLLDITMPGMGGLGALERIKAKLPNTKVVMLTVSDQDTDLFQAIQSGAEGYLLKDLSADEFLQMLQGLRQGEAALTRRMTARLMRGFADRSHGHDQPTEGLTQRELELLQLVAQGMSNKAVALELSISENTVKYHMRSILQKLDAQNRTEAVAHAIGAGLLEPNLPD